MSIIIIITNIGKLLLRKNTGKQWSIETPCIPVLLAFLYYIFNSFTYFFRNSRVIHCIQMNSIDITSQ